MVIRSTRGDWRAWTCIDLFMRLFAIVAHILRIFLSVYFTSVVKNS